VKVIGPLTDPVAHGGRARDAFDLVLPSMRGDGFVGRPTSTGCSPDHITRARLPQDPVIRDNCRAGAV